jgi:NAD(P)H dehydrogenase (quinone)
MAGAVKEGAERVAGARVGTRRVTETLSEEVLEKMGGLKFQKSLAYGPVCSPDDLRDADAIIFGTPTRFGNMCGQMRQFLDATGGLWSKGVLVGKVLEFFHAAHFFTEISPLAIQASIASLSNRHTLPIRIAGNFPSFAYLQMVIS